MTHFALDCPQPTNMMCCMAPQCSRSISLQRAVLMYCSNSSTRLFLLPWPSRIRKGGAPSFQSKTPILSTVFSICPNQLRRDASTFGALEKGRHVVAIEVAGWSHWMSSSPSNISGNIVFVSNQIYSRIKPKHPRLFHLFCIKYNSTLQRHPIGSCETQDCEVAILCGFE